MRQISSQLPAFNTVAVSTPAITKLPRNRRYHGIILQYKAGADNQATIEGALGEIRVKVNDRVVWQITVQQLNLLNALYGIPFVTGLVQIWFTDPKRATPEGSEYLAWPIFEMLGLADLSIEVDVTGAAVAPALTGRMIWDNERPADQFADVLKIGTAEQQARAPLLRTVMHRIKKVTPCAAAFPIGAPLTPNDFVPAVNGILHAVHHFDAVVTQAIFRSNENPFWDGTRIALPAVYGPFGITQQAGVFSAVLDHDRQYVNGLPIPSVPDLKHDIITSGAATGNAITSILEIRKPFERV